jgi:outer membrane receptor protein involved in Fe transport
MNLRLAWSRTLNRPELRELSPFSMYNFETGYSEVGDTALVTAKVVNYDLRWEVFPGPGEFFAVALFYKDFDRPIQKYVYPNVGDYALQPLNAESAKLYGWETELRLSFVNVWRAMDWAMDLGEVPASMLRWSLVANYSRVHSEVDIGQGSGSIPFNGQSPHSANLGLFYTSGKQKLEAGLLYTSFGKRLDAFGRSIIGDIYEYPPESLDLTVSYRLGASARLKLSAENLLDEPTIYRQGKLITQQYDNGTTFGLSVGYQPAASEED